MSELNGYVKLYRCLLDNPIVCKDAEHFAVWCYLLLKATHKEYDAVFKGERITLKRGQLITGRKKISSKLSVSESKVQRILKSFENEQQIEQQMDSRNRLISIVKWELYQRSEQLNEQQVNSNRTASEQLVNTNKNVKNDKKVKNVKKVKNIYGEYGNVFLTSDEFEKLVEDFSDYKQRIEKLSEYIASKGDKYKSHYATIRMWAAKDNKADKKGDSFLGL